MIEQRLLYWFDVLWEFCLAHSESPIIILGIVWAILSCWGGYLMISCKSRTPM